MNTKIDKRTTDRYIDKGLIKRSDYESYLKTLPDESNNATWVHMDMEEAEITSRASNGTHDSGTPEGT